MAQTFDSPSAEWVSPVGGALSRHTSTWEVHAAGVHRGGQVVPRSKQPRRCQAAEEARGPQSARAQVGATCPNPVDPVPVRFASASRGVWKFYCNQKFTWRSLYEDRTNCLAV
jgi:hypothetical protein